MRLTKKQCREHIPKAVWTDGVDTDCCIELVSYEPWGGKRPDANQSSYPPVTSGRVN